MELTDMDYIRGALYNAIASGLTLQEVTDMAEHADTPQDFDEAVNIFSTATPNGQGAVWTPQGWVSIT